MFQTQELFTKQHWVAGNWKLDTIIKIIHNLTNSIFYHPYCPLDSWQQVLPSGQDEEPPGHGTSSTFSICLDSVFK